MPIDEHPEHELVNVAVPRRHYALVLRTLADAMAVEAGVNPSTQGGATLGAGEMAAAERWTPDAVRRLRRLLTNPTALALLELTCAEPGRRVSLSDIREKAGRTFHQSRADLAVLTKLIRQRFGHDRWPVNASQTSDGTLAYDASPEIAAAWNSNE
jgi:hypothetical protein